MNVSGLILLNALLRIQKENYTVQCNRSRRRISHNTGIILIRHEPNKGHSWLKYKCNHLMELFLPKIWYTMRLTLLYVSQIHRKCLWPLGMMTTLIVAECALFQCVGGGRGDRGWSEIVTVQMRCELPFVDDYDDGVTYIWFSPSLPSLPLSPSLSLSL